MVAWEGLEGLITLMSTVSQAIQTINEAVEDGEATKTLAALRNPGAGLYGVTPECAQTYQDDLTKAKQDKKKDGEDEGAGYLGSAG